MEKSKIILGTWSWGAGAAGGDQVFGNHTDKESLRPVFDAAMKMGMNCWDTAFVYGMGASEDILGAFAKEVKRENIILSDKFTPQCAAIFNNSVEEMCDAELERLGVDYLDIFWIHNPMDVERWTPGLIPLLKSGKVKSVGVSNHNIEEIKRAHEILGKEGFKVSAVQNHYSLLYRSSEKGEVLDYCKQNGIDFWAYMVIEQGALSGKYDSRNPMPEESDRGKRYNPVLDKLSVLTDAMKEIGKGYNISCSQVALAWALTKGTTPIVGATKEKHIVEAAGAIDVRLTQEEMRRLEQLAEATGIDSRGEWEHSME